MQKSSFESVQELLTVRHNNGEQTHSSEIKHLAHEAASALRALSDALETAYGAAPRQQEETAHTPAVQSDDTIEGVFDGRAMIAEDGAVYPVPPNYASKSRLLEGDILTLTGDRYRQVHRMERKAINGTVEQVGETACMVRGQNGTCYQVLPETIRFFRASCGDILTLEVPTAEGAAWAAVVGRSREWYTTRPYERIV